MSEGRFLYHTSCDACGSSDARAVYDTNTWYCFSCGASGREGDKPERRQNRLDTNFIEGVAKSLEKRKITKETCKKFNYTVGKYKKHPVQIAPYYWKGELVAQHLRFPDKSFSWIGKTGHLELFGQHLWAGRGKRLVITEGEIDCLTISQVFNNRWSVVSIPSGAKSAAKYIKQNLEFVEGYEEVVLAFDNDEEGRDAVHKVASLITAGKVKVANFSPYKDANEMLQKTGSTSKIAEAVFNAKPYRPDGILNGRDLTLSDLKLDNIFSFDLPYPSLNRTLKGLRKKEITILTAGSGIGKTTLAHELGYHLLKTHNCKIAVIALEESYKLTCLTYMAIHLNKPKGELLLNQDELSSNKEFQQAFEDVIKTDRFYTYDHFGSLDTQNLISKLKFLAVGCGVDFIILDHISIVVSGLESSSREGERKDIDILMTNLRSLVEQTGVGVIGIVHLKRKEGRKSFNEGGQVSLSDLRGSGSLEQLSDNVVALERNQQDPENPHISHIRVLKNRLFGTTGLCDTLEYNPETGRLLSIEDSTESDVFSADGEQPSDESVSDVF